MNLAVEILEIMYKINDAEYRKEEKTGDEVIKYLGFKLPNKLKVLIVSNSNAAKATVHYTIGVGTNQDPPDFQGLAHFCEHMVHLGTEKYPNDNVLNKFTGCSGAERGASTGSQHTKFYFKISEDKLEEALDQLAQMFIAPLFKEEFVTSEVEVIESEFLMKEENNHNAVRQVLMHIKGNQKFQCGNKKTLLEEPSKNGLNLHRALRDFHNKWYSSDLSALVILTKRPADEIAEFLKTSSDIAKIPNRNQKSERLLSAQNVEGNIKALLSVPKKSGRNLNSKLSEFPVVKLPFSKIVQIIPPTDCSQLSVIFPLYNLKNDIDAEIYVKHLLEHEGPGSLFAELKRRNWATSDKGIRKYSDVVSKINRIVEVRIQLTKGGFDNFDQVLKLLFNYIGMLWLRSDTYEKHKNVYDEMNYLKEINSRYQDCEKPMVLAERLSRNLLTSSFRKAVAQHKGKEEHCAFNHAHIDKILQQLNPVNMRLVLLSNHNMGDEMNKKEPIYGTEYSIMDISESLKRECYLALMKPNGQFHLPKSNVFVPKELSLSGYNESSTDYNLPSTDWIRCSYKRHNSIVQVPKIATKIVISSSAFQDDAFSKTVASLFVDCFIDSLEVEIYAATLAGIKYQIEFDHKSLQLVIQAVGFSDKHSMFVEFIMKKLANLCPDEKMFENLLKRKIMEVANGPFKPPIELSRFLLEQTSQKNVITSETYLSIYESVTIEDIINIKSLLLASFSVDMSCFGNITKKDLSQLAETVLNTLQTENSVPFIQEKTMQSDSDFSITPGQTYISRHQQNHYTSSAVTLRLETHPEDNTTDRVIANLLSNILNVNGFNTLRTKEHLGYIVQCKFSKLLDREGITFKIQGPNNPEYILHRTEHFLEEFLKKLEMMSITELLQWNKNLRNGSSTCKSKSAKSLFVLDSTGFQEQKITTDSSVQTEDSVKFTHQQVVDFYKRKILSNGAEMRKIAILVYGKHEKPGLFYNDPPENEK